MGKRFYIILSVFAALFLPNIVFWLLGGYGDYTYRFEKTSLGIVLSLFEEEDFFREYLFLLFLLHLLVNTFIVYLIISLLKLLKRAGAIARSRFLYATTINAVLLGGVFLFDWSTTAIVVWFFLETILIFLTDALQIFLHMKQKFSARKIKSVFRRKSKTYIIVAIVTISIGGSIWHGTNKIEFFRELFVIVPTIVLLFVAKFAIGAFQTNMYTRTTVAALEKESGGRMLFLFLLAMIWLIVGEPDIISTRAAVLMFVTASLTIPTISLIGEKVGKQERRKHAV